MKTNMTLQEFLDELNREGKLVQMQVVQHKTNWFLAGLRFTFGAATAIGIIGRLVILLVNGN